MAELVHPTPEYPNDPGVDTTNCEREPIHIPGSVQPHGVLLVLTPDLGIVQVSANAERFLGLPPEQLLNQPLQNHVQAHQVENLQRFLLQGDRQTNAQYVFTLSFGIRSMDAAAHRSGDLVIIELEPPGAPATSPDFIHAVKNALSDLEAAPDVPALLQAAARQVRRLTGFDRVMVYRFMEDDSGEVVAEARRDDLGAFLGHRFPESDIPRQARALYVRNHLRLTADVHAASAPLVPPLNPVTGAPLDLGGAVLRATSPVHVQYLKNMGVASSLSVSIVQDGRLWGLIACHHLSAKFVPQATRGACEFLGRVLALHVKAKREADTFRYRDALRQRWLLVVNAIGSTLDPLGELQRPELDVMGLMRASGLVMRFAGRSASLGNAPDAASVGALVGWLRSRGEAVFHTDALARSFPPAERVASEASGVLGFSLSGAWDEYLLWFRPEVARTITWGGDPRKPVEVTPGTAVQLTPRRSFETYLESVRHTAEPWHPGEVEEVVALRAAFMETLSSRLTALQELNAELERSNTELRRLAFATERLEGLAYTDALTGLLNRRRFDEDLSQPERPAYLLLLDVDYFKRFNDTYGHDVGDQVLKHTARVLRDAARGTDEVYRLGGEEFAVILSPCKVESAAVVAERLRISVEQRVAGLAGLPGETVTVSGGLVEVRGAKRDVLRAADELLYQAKASGRNQIRS